MYEYEIEAAARYVYTRPFRTGLPVDVKHPFRTGLPVNVKRPFRTGLPVDVKHPFRTGLPVDVKRPFRTGFAARCEARLCLAVGFANPLGYARGSATGPN